MKRTAEEVANQKNQIIEKREARIHELEAENEQLREAVKEAVDQIFLSSDGRTLDHHAHDDLIEAGKKLQNTLNDTGNENGSESQANNPKRLSKVGPSLIDEETEVVVAEINNLAYPEGVLIEIAWRYNKYPGLKQGYERLRKASKEAMGMMTERGVSGDAPLEEVSPIIEVLRSALDGGGDDQE